MCRDFPLGGALSWKMLWPFLLQYDRLLTNFLAFFKILGGRYTPSRSPIGTSLAAAHCSQSPEKCEPSSASHLFTYKLPQYTASIQSFPIYPSIFLMLCNIIVMDQNFPQASFFTKLLGLPQNWHKSKKTSTGSKPWSRDFSGLCLLSSIKYMFRLLLSKQLFSQHIKNDNFDMNLFLFFKCAWNNTAMHEISNNTTTLESS